MLGDDFADRGVWAESYGDPRLKNRGVDGDNLSGLNYRLDDVIAGKPAKIFLSIGKRDLNAGVSPRVASDRLGRSSPESSGPRSVPGCTSSASFPTWRPTRPT